MKRPSFRKPSLRKAAAVGVVGVVLLGGGYAAAALTDSGGGSSVAASTTTTSAAARPSAPPASGTKTTKTRRDHGRLALRAAIKALAPVLGVTPRQLMTDLRSGQSVAQVAQAHGVDPQKAIDAIVAAGTQRIQTAETAGKITAEQAQKRLAKLPALAARLVNRTRSPGANRGGANGSAATTTSPGSGSTNTAPSTTAPAATGSSGGAGAGGAESGFAGA